MKIRILAAMLSTIWCAAAIAADRTDSPPAPANGERTGAPAGAAASGERTAAPADAAGGGGRTGAPADAAAGGQRAATPAAPNEAGERGGDRLDPRGARPGAAGPFDGLSGLTDDQRAKFNEIRAKYEELMRKQREEMMAVLTDAQRKEFEESVTRRQKNRGGGARPDGVGGKGPAETTISKVDGTNVWVKAPQGRGSEENLLMVATDDKTVVTLDGKPAKLSDLKEGLRATIDHPLGTAVRIDAHTAADPAPVAPARSR